jgi:hypothetical protein
MLPLDPGFARLQGTYVGTMFYYDQLQKKDLEMPIQVRFGEGVYDTKYRFAPPEYSWAVDSIEISEDGTQWIERNLGEKFAFQLKNWSEFENGKSNWFEIERTQLTSNFVGLFRRRWSLAPNGDLISEKWLKPNGKEWEVSHRMVLKRNL